MAPYFRSFATLLFIGLGLNSWAATYNPASNFEAGFIAQSSPNGVWFHSYSPGFATPVTLFSNTVQGGLDSSNEQFWLSPSINGELAGRRA